MYVVYLVTNTANNKAYVGFTSKTADKRWRRHVSVANSGSRDFYFHRAIRKHGEKSFVVQTLATVDTQEQARDREQMWVMLLQSYKKKYGYNSTLGGEGFGVLTEEARARRSAAEKGKVRSQETKAKIAAYRRGRIHSPETRRKLSRPAETSEALLRYWADKKLRMGPITLSAEHKAKISAALKGKTPSVEARKNMSEAAKNRRANKTKTSP